MASSIWNKKISGIPGAVGIGLSIVWERIANWFTTRAMLGNIKKHGKNILVMRGCVYRSPQRIVLGDNVIIGRKTIMTADICKEYDDPKCANGGGVFVCKSLC